MKPHKHSKEIHAWAESKKIERRSTAIWNGVTLSNWVYEENPSWDLLETYRVMPDPIVKPEPLVMYANEYDRHDRRYAKILYAHNTPSDAKNLAGDGAIRIAVRMVEDA